MERKRRRERRAPQPRHPWYLVRVVLAGKPDEPLDEPPGRDFLVGPRHTLAELADAIDAAFARWDPHLHFFGLDDQRVVAPAELEQEDAIDERRATLVSIGLQKDGRFAYVFDIGDEWRHVCTILRDDIDPTAEFGVMPGQIVAVFGWGAIPDQYGRRAPSDDEDDEGEAEDEAQR